MSEDVLSSAGAGLCTGQRSTSPSAVDSTYQLSQCSAARARRGSALASSKAPIFLLAASKSHHMPLADMAAALATARITGIGAP
jgi:hypothetical protein